MKDAKQHVPESRGASQVAPAQLTRRLAFPCACGSLQPRGDSMAAGEKKCPRCAEHIKVDALVCRHCGHEFSQAEVEAERGRRSRGRTIGLLLVGAIGIYAISRMSIEDLANTTAELEHGAEATTPATRVRMDGFTWENHGDTYCRANAKLTNESDGEVKFLKVTLQFMEGGSIVGSEDSYADIQYLQPGASSTWKGFYRCPGRNTQVEVSAVSQGEEVSIYHASDRPSESEPPVPAPPPGQPDPACNPAKAAEIGLTC